jgi:hypothetical protein
MCRKLSWKVTEQKYRFIIRMKSTHLIVLILLFYLFFTFPDQALDISITPLGRFISIALILYYTYIHRYYGLLMCAIVIFYYQLDCVEGMARWTENSILTDTYPTTQTSPKQYIRKTTDISDSTQLYETPVKTSVLLEYENNKIADESCRNRVGNGKVNVVDQLNMEEQLTYPNKV